MLLAVLTPMSSTNILSRPTGPRELLTMLAIDAAAMTAQIKYDAVINKLTSYLVIEVITSEIRVFCHLI